MEAIEESGDFDAFSKTVMEAVEKYREATSRWAEAEKKYIPLMSTFFRNKKYMDDPETWRSASRPSHGGYDFSNMKPVKETTEGNNDVF